MGLGCTRGGGGGRGHLSVGMVELGVFVSPGDPDLLSHHGNMDRQWAIWQGAGSGGTDRGGLGHADYGEW